MDFRVLVVVHVNMEVASFWQFAPSNYQTRGSYIMSRGQMIRIRVVRGNVEYKPVACRSDTVVL